MNLSQEHKWRVKETVHETPGVTSLYLQAEGERPAFIAGQYLTVKLPGVGPSEGKAYSISSAPHEMEVRITVRKIGDFSTALSALAVGDTLTTSAPYGFFYPEPEEEDELIFIAGGIGITPCLSIIKDLWNAGATRRISLIYSNQQEEDIVFRDELAKMSDALQVTHHVTRRPPESGDVRAGRMTPESILSGVHDPTTAEFFICGSMDFTKSLWKALYETGIPQHQLYTEGFF